MKAENLTRYGAEVAGVLYSYEHILRTFICDKCGGGLIHRFDQEGDEVVCGVCGSHEIVSETRYDQQVSDAAYMLTKPHFRKLFGYSAPRSLDAQSAIAELFGEEQ